jgi:hypothetical protein
MSAPMHRYFLDRAYGENGTRELPFPAWQPSLPAELRYPYDVLQEALPQIGERGLHFYFTKDAYALPEYGPHVVAVLVQEERCKVPVYGRHVRATIRNLTSRPFLGFRPGLRVGHLEAVMALEYVRDWYTHARSVRASTRTPPAWGAPLRAHAVVMELPLGYHSQEELPQLPMERRPLDAFFAGQIKHHIARSDYRHWISTSKFIAREQLWREMKRLHDTRQWNIDLGDIGATEQASNAAFSNYSQKMMHTRICVAPRGSVAPSYRAFEGLRAGCLVVANRMPDEPALTGSPILQVDHWRELEGVLRRYARDIPLLEEARVASLAWWQKALATRVVGAAVARAFNDSAPQAPA